MSMPIDLATMRSRAMIRSMVPEGLRRSDLRPREHDEHEESDEPHD